MQSQTIAISRYFLFDRSEVKVKDGVKFWEVGNLQLETGTVLSYFACIDSLSDCQGSSIWSRLHSLTWVP